jgi:type I restriction enzyme, S subunit
MAVKEGYKQTEVGVIPEDWSLVTLSEVCLLSKKKHTPINSNDNYKCIELEHVEQNTGRLLDYTESKKQLSQKNYFYIGSVLFGKLRPYLRKFHYAGFDGVCSTEMWVLLPSVNTDSKYLYYLMQSEPVIEACNKSVGTKMPRADWNIVNNTLVGLPPLPEQKAIATALSDIDGLIDSLSKLIEKKKNIKQGAMQELLTGKKRLEGFSGEWKERQLGEIGEVNMCKRIFAHQTTASGDIPFYKIGTFGKKPDAHIARSLYDEYVKKYSFPIKGDILLSAAGTIGRTVEFNGTPSYFQDSNIVWIEIDKSKICNEYLYHYYRVIQWASSEGSTISRLYNGIIKATNIKLPPTLAEQTAIATILSDMDLEIEKLQSKLDKYKAIKQGMMQELLTGRIRLLEGA